MWYLVLILVAFALVSPTAAAQTTPPAAPPSPEATALRNCTALADEGKGEAAVEPGKVAEAFYMKRVARNPGDVEALVGAARAKSQCLLPSAGFMSQGELSSDAMELLDRALAVQPDHWMARFVLASIAYRSPAFLGRGKRAAKEFDELLRMQGDRADHPLYARVFALRGLQLSRQGQADSAHALWIRGAALFPADVELRGLAKRAKASDTTSRREEAPANLSAVKVTATTAPRKAPLPSVKDVTRSQVLMTAGGAADILQSVQMQPGATRVSEGGDVYTRGGDATETALMLNGGRILSLSRFEGLNGSMFGAIEPFVVKSVRYYSGGFSAKHGNVLSGVVEIETDGRPRERQTRAGLSLVQASGTVRAPFTSRLGGWLSARVSHTAALLETHGRTAEFSGAPRSQEAIGSLIATPTPFTELRLSGVVERDDSRRHVNAAGWRGVFDSNGDTRALQLTSRWMSSSAPLVVRGSVAGSSRSTAWAFGALSRDRDERGVGTRVDAEWQAVPSLLLRAGAEHGAQDRLERGTAPTTASVVAGAPVRALTDGRAGANQIGGYAETEWVAGIFSVTTGMRVDRLPGETEATLDPRLALAARAGDWTARVSGGLFHQGRWRGDAAIPDAGTPSGLPREARHLVFGVERETSASLLRAEAFVKRYGDYRAFGAGPAIERGDIRGADVIVQRVSGPLTGFAGYSLIDATSRLASGAMVRGAFDVTHSATASVTANLPRDWSVGTSARYGTGAPKTPIVGGQQTPEGRTVPVYGALMSDRLPAYARIDARVMRHIRMPGALLTTFVEMFNATGRANVAAFTYDATYSSREVVHTFFAQRTLVMGGELMFR